MRDIKYHTALIIANILFGANYSFYSSLIGHAISPEGLYVLRTLSAAIFFIPIMFITRNYKVHLRDLYKFAIVSILLLFGRQFLMLKGMDYTSPIDGSIIATMGPIMIMIISAFMLKEKSTFTRILGISLGAAGAIILIMSNMSGGSVSGKMLGNILLVISILLSSINTVFVKDLFEKYSPYTVIGWAYLIALLYVAPIFGPSLMKTDFSHWNASIYGSMAYLLIVGTGLSMVLFFYGLKGVTATASSIYVYIQPIVGTALAVLRGQDKITIITISSASLIFAGVFFVIRSYRRSPRPTTTNQTQH